MSDFKFNIIISFFQRNILDFKAMWSSMVGGYIMQTHSMFYIMSKRGALDFAKKVMEMPHCWNF